MTFNKSKPNPKRMIGLSMGLAWSRARSTPEVKEKIRHPSIMTKGEK